MVYLIFYTLFILCILGYMGYSLYTHLKRAIINVNNYEVNSRIVECCTNFLIKDGITLIKMTLYGKDYNFILDTGSTHNIIASSFLDTLNDDIELKLADSDSVIDASGNLISCNSVYLKWAMEDKFGEDPFIIHPNIDKAFEEIKQKNGIKISGIIGINFFKKYNCTIDFTSKILVIAKEDK